MEHELAVREVDRGADLDEEREPALERQPPPVAPGVDRLAVDVLEHQVGGAVRRRAAVEQTGDPRMLERGEDAALGGEALVAEPAGEVGADPLHRHHLVEGAVGAPRAPDRAHAAGADLGLEPPRPDPLRRGRAAPGGGDPLHRALGEEPPAVGGGLVHATELRGELRVGESDPLERRGPLLRRQLEQVAERVAQSRPARASRATRASRHAWPSSWRSQARAAVHSRLTVRSETSSAAPISSCERPPK